MFHYILTDPKVIIEPITTLPILYSNSFVIISILSYQGLSKVDQKHSAESSYKLSHLTTSWTTLPLLIQLTSNENSRFLNTLPVALN